MEAFDSFVELVKQLRSPEGCPWDQEQTFQSLKPHIIEEAYELSEALSENNPQNLKEELGDVLLHVVMLSNMAQEQALFSIVDVINDIHNKMIERHPHVFGDTSAKTADQVRYNWESIKQKNKTTKSVMDSVPKSLPSLLQATKIQKRASRLGFDWETPEGPIEKLYEEINELKDALKSTDKTSIEEESGDILFALVNILRKHDINPELALQNSNQKFIRRFKDMEAHCDDNNIAFSTLPLTEKEALWNHAKSKEKRQQP